MLEFAASRLRLAAAAMETATAFRGFWNAYQAGFDADVAAHPDLAEMNVMMDGYYAETDGAL